MTTSPHPVAAPFNNRSASEIIAYEKLHQRVVVADVNEVRNTDFTGQFGGLYVKSNAANYNLDTESTDPDDGVSTLIDGPGNHFVKVVDSQDLTQRVVTASGAVTISADDVDIIIIKKTVGAATAVTLPSAADRTRPIRIVDGKGDASTNNITVSPQSGETAFATTDYQYVIDQNGGDKTFTPLNDGTGWI